MQSGDCEAAKLGKYDLADIGLAPGAVSVEPFPQWRLWGRKWTGGFEAADFQSGHFSTSAPLTRLPRQPVAESSRGRRWSLGRISFWKPRLPEALYKMLARSLVSKWLRGREMTNGKMRVRDEE